MANEIRLTKSNKTVWEQYLRFLVQWVSSECKDNVILKGGTALRLVYGLTRHSFDLDFDGMIDGSNSS
jgi:predicted nucleotidyltransferase component of viral defense system